MSVTKEHKNEHLTVATTEDVIDAIETATDAVEDNDAKTSTVGLAIGPTEPMPTGGVTDDEPEYLNRSGRRYLFSLLRKTKRGPNFTKAKKRK